MDIIAILPRIEAFSTLQARMDPAVGSKRKLNPSSPEGSRGDVEYFLSRMVLVMCCGGRVVQIPP